MSTDPILAGGRRSPERRFRSFFFRFLVPLICLGGLLLLLGIIYRGPIGTNPPTEAALDAGPPKPTYASLKGQYMEMITGGFDTFKAFQPSRYRGREEGVDAELAVFQSWSLLINEMENYPLDESERDKVVSLARQLSALQERELPAMRADWAKSVRRSLEKYKAVVYCGGQRSEVLNVICPPQPGDEAANRCLEKISGDIAAQLRFSKINYTFTAGQTVTAPVKLTKKPPPPDDRLVYWQNTLYQPVKWPE